MQLNEDGKAIAETATPNNVLPVALMTAFFADASQ
jgi:hypothetical protein